MYLPIPTSYIRIFFMTLCSIWQETVLHLQLMFYIYIEQLLLFTLNELIDLKFRVYFADEMPVVILCCMLRIVLY